MNLQFRPCTAADLPLLQQHVLSLYQEDPNFAPMSPDKICQTFREFSLRPEKGRILVFDLNGDIVGYAILVFFWSNEYGGDFVEIDELFVQEAYRSQGIGRRFLQWLEVTWQSQAVALSLQAAPENQRAIALYQRLGFSLSNNFHLVKPLNPIAAPDSIRD